MNWKSAIQDAKTSDVVSTVWNYGDGREGGGRSTVVARSAIFTRGSRHNFLRRTGELCEALKHTPQCLMPFCIEITILKKKIDQNFKFLSK